MIIKVISDLHINVKKLENDFLIDDDKFIKYITDICENSNLVVINGDLFELWETLQWKRHLVHFKKIINERNAICNVLFKYILSGKIVYISGNHDDIIRLKNILPITDRYILKHNGTTVLFEHGHMADVTNSKYEFIGKFFSFIGGWLERIFDKDIDLKVKRIANKMIPGNVINDNKLYSYAKKLSKQFKANLVVFGHTHRPMIKDDGEFVYINSGFGCDRVNQLTETTITINKTDCLVKQDTITLN